MGLYNFDPRFVADIESGEITQTIRAPRLYGRQRSPGRQDEPGDVMHLYTGMRTKACRLLGRFPCAAVEQIRIADMWAWSPAIWINGELLTMDESEDFAHSDGFKTFSDFRRYWLKSGKIPFDGFVFHWNFAQPVFSRQKKIVKRGAAFAPERRARTTR